MRHDDECAWNDDDCGCAARAAARRRETHDTATAYRFIMLGGRVSPETWPFPVVSRPIRIVRGNTFGMTEDGAFVVPL